MGVNLKYDLADFTTNIQRIRSLSTSISISKTNFYNGFEKLRKDWQSEGATAFFNSLDLSWLTGVDECISILDDLADALEDARDEYTNIEPEANTKLNF